jgi:hypothetical protein
MVVLLAETFIGSTVTPYAAPAIPIPLFAVAAMIPITPVP